MTVTPVDSGPRKVSRTADIAVPAADLFEVLADPRRHGQLDGSGTVLDLASGPDRLSNGARFGVKMKQYGTPYRITSTVTAFDEGTLIEWRHPLGHRWRWELTPVSEGATRVVETFDFSQMSAVGRGLITLFGSAKTNAKGIEKTLTQLQAQHAG